MVALTNTAGMPKRTAVGSTEGCHRPLRDRLIEMGPARLWRGHHADAEPVTAPSIHHRRRGRRCGRRCDKVDGRPHQKRYLSSSDRGNDPWSGGSGIRTHEASKRQHAFPGVRTRPDYAIPPIYRIVGAVHAVASGSASKDIDEVPSQCPHGERAVGAIHLHLDDERPSNYGLTSTAP